MPSLTSKVSGDLVLSLHGAEAPSASEWETHLALLEELARRNGGSLARMRSLVFSDGGMPDSAQRQASTRIIDAADGTRMPIAIVSNSGFVRGVVTAGHWFGLSMRAFAPAGLREALAYLQIPEGRHAEVRRHTTELALGFRCEALNDAHW